MTTFTPALVAVLHLVGAAFLFACSALRLLALRNRDVALTRFADNGNGIGALLLYGAGLWRLFGELEKPLVFYTENPVFWGKVGLLGVATLLEIYPQYVVLPWHIRHAKKQPIEPKPGQFERMYTCALWQLPCLLGIVVLAALMSRGIGLPVEENAKVELSGRDVYVVHCQSCHQADGRGLDGKLAASFVGDASVLKKSDEQLLRSIEHGVNGPTGTMPGWGSVLSASERREVLAFLRASYGKQ